MFTSIRSKLFLSYLALSLITIMLMGVLGEEALEKYLGQRLMQEQLEQATIIGELLTPILLEHEAERLQDVVESLGEKTNTRLMLLDLKGFVLADSQASRSGGNFRDLPEVQEALKTGVGTYKIRGEKEEFLAVAQLIKGDGTPLAVVRLLTPLSQGVIHPLELMNNQLVGYLFLVALVAILCSASFAQGLTSPMHQITKMAQKIKAGDFNLQIFPPTRDEMGQLAMAINQMARTIREKVEELSLVKDRLETIINYMASGVLLLNSKGEIILANPAAETIFGLTTNNYLGRHNLEVIRNYHLNERAQETLKSGDLITADFKLIFPEERELRAYFAPLPLERTGKGVLVVLHDVTALRQLEKTRTDFVANASHELRTPLTVIKGFAETLLDGALEEPNTSRKFVSIIHQETERLIRLVEDLLDLATLETEKIELEKKPLSLGPLIREIAVELKNSVEKKGLKLFLDVSWDLPQVQGDRGWLHQVLLNLLDNALKYTPSGGQIRIGAWQEGDEIKVEVEDTGVGIPQKDLPRIFERFYRVDKARSRQLGGTGLGLSIVKHIIERHGGKIGIKSEEGRGTKVWFTLPYNKRTKA